MNGRFTLVTMIILQTNNIVFIVSHTSLVAVWLSGNIVGRINEVTLRRAGLVLRWVTVCGYTVLVSNQATQAHSAWPSLRG